MKPKGCFLAISLFLAILPGRSQDLAETRMFADQLYYSGQYAQALSAYHRVAYFEKQQTNAPLLLRIAECYLANNDLNNALEYFDHSYFAEESDSMKVEILFRKSDSYLRTHQYNLALTELLSLDDQKKTWYYKRMQFLQGMCWFGLEDFPRAMACFMEASQGEGQAEKIEAIFADRRNLFRPNPRVASWLSVFIPGSGQIYSGETIDGINSMLLTGSFVALAFYLAVTTSPLDAILTAVPWFQRYYQGGFQRAEEFAKQKRAENRNNTFNQILTVLSGTSGSI